LDLPRITTERLMLRLPEPHDVPALVRFHAENAAHLAPTSPRRPPDFLTAEYWRREVSRGHEEFRSGHSVRFCLFPRDDPATVAGHVNLNSIQRGAAQYCDLGIALAERLQGQGLMTEAVEAVIRYAFVELRLHRVKACYLPTNERSGRLLRRLGFVVEGYARDYLLIDGRWQDQILVGLINPEWQPPG
jgi:[ribosomal protein S5]-alanine N-acetyltransferase